SVDFSHFLAKSSLSVWLKENDIPAIYGLDTRALTKKIRQQGVMLGKILFPKAIVGGDDCGASLGISNSAHLEAWMKDYKDVAWVDPNEKNLVAEGRWICLNIKKKFF